MRIFMGKKFYVLFIGLLLSLVSSCDTITRFAEDNEELASKKMPMETGENIFRDFLWTTPPVYSIRLDFRKEGDLSEAETKFGGKTLTFILNENDEIALKNDGETVFKKPERSDGDIYYNLDILKTKLVPRQMLVTKTRFVTRSVPITRTRPMIRTRFVTRFDPKGRSYTTSETYTDWETYVDYEYRTLPETYTDWETVQARVIDIPDYLYYSFSLDKNQHVVIYRIDDESSGSHDYYFQNTTYFSAVKKEGSDDGDVETKLLFIDTNSNGIYFENDDAVLFNVWNPYEHTSHFRELSNYMDNYWYRLKTLKTEKFLSFGTDADFNSLVVENANSAYIFSDKKGKVEIDNVPEDASVFFNGEEYLAFDGKIKRRIEYGVYNLKIENPGYLDYNAYFIIDDSNPELAIEYKSPGKGGTFVFENDYLRNWKILASSDKTGDTVYYNRNEITLPEGMYKIAVIAGGFRLEKNIRISIGKKTTLNYNDEVEKLIRDYRERDKKRIN